MEVRDVVKGKLLSIERATRVVIQMMANAVKRGSKCRINIKNDSTEAVIQLTELSPGNEMFARSCRALHNKVTTDFNECIDPILNEADLGCYLAKKIKGLKQRQQISLSPQDILRIIKTG